VQRGMACITLIFQSITHHFDFGNTKRGHYLSKLCQMLNHNETISLRCADSSGDAVMPLGSPRIGHGSYGSISRQRRLPEIPIICYTFCCVIMLWYIVR